MRLESVRAAEKTIQRLFSGNLTSSQAFDTLNSVLVFYSVPRISAAFFERYITGSGCQSVDAFERGVRKFQAEAIRLFSTFAEAYYRMNEADGLKLALTQLAQRDLAPYNERTVWEHADPAQAVDDPIVPLPEDKLEFLGYISVAKYRTQRRQRGTLAKYLQELASQVRKDGARAVEELGEKRRRKLDSLLRELGTTLMHTPMSPLFVANPAELDSRKRTEDRRG